MSSRFLWPSPYAVSAPRVPICLCSEGVSAQRTGPQGREGPVGPLCQGTSITAPRTAVGIKGTAHSPSQARRPG